MTLVQPIAAAILAASIPLTSGHVGSHWDPATFNAAQQWPAGGLNCAHGFRDFDPLTQKRTYYVGVHAPAGIETAMREFNLTFETYLSHAVGKRWIPPIEFKMKPTEDPLRDWVDMNEDVDFMYSDTGLYSCIGTEIGGQPLGTTISNLEARGQSYNLDMYGGTMIVRSDNRDINTIEDLEDKIIGAQSISDFAGAQVQFYVMHKNNLDYIMDPRQVVFTGDQEEIVKGVLDGRFDVGFTRTGQIERTKDEEGEFIDPNLFKVIEPKIYVMDDGDLFPFLHSTPVFPEWPLFAKQQVDRMVSEEVALALINFEYHKIVGDRMNSCVDTNNETMNVVDCDIAPPVYFDHLARCDTTRELAELAYQAGIAGRHNGFRPARSHFGLRTMQQDAGFLVQSEDGDWHCPRAATLYEAIACPEGHYKVPEAHFDEQCKNAGQPCPDGSTCYCRPCIKAFEVDVAQWHDDMMSNMTMATEHKDGCEKMSVCGTVQQTKDVVFRAVDNRERSGVTLSVLMHIGQESRYLDVSQVSDYTYEFGFSHDQRGVGILEVFVNDEQIPESPFRVDVVERSCEEDYPGQGKESTPEGDCECSTGNIEIGDKCVSTGIIAAIASSVAFVIAMAIGYCYLSYRRAKNDEMWQVNTEELHFSHPVEVVGQGAFGVVLLAEYRGTKVAIKRVLPQKGSSKGVTRSGSINASTDVVPDQGSVDDVESQDTPAAESDSTGMADNRSGTASSNFDDDDDGLDFLGGLSMGKKRKGWKKYLPAYLFPDQQSKYNLSILGTATGSANTSRTAVNIFCPCFNDSYRRQQEFMAEMRLLSRLRHPCITTVMGAVVSRGCEPMMVMEYMENGSLFDLLRNETLYTGGEIIIQIVRDVAQGLRFLHASKPPILHGDLKARNILIDSRFRAKVADFGLATKKKNGLAGTPYWMAPEYLRMKTEYNTSCDIYAFGIIMYEIYSRKTPYEGEHPRKVLRRVCDPRINYRPPIPATCPPKMTEIMQKCWSNDPFFRPQAKDLDLLFMDMNPNDAEPLLLEDANTRMRTQVATGDMLYKVFPRKIADKLKAGQKVEPETHDNVTIFFSDIVKFTDISRALSPVKVCGMLDRLYLAFDALASKHEVFKVETIGDAWMGVTNLENNQNESHVRRIAEFAIDAVEAAGQVLIDEDNPEAGYVHIRVGFHSGPVVSNVIGSLNPRFGLFGDTVNTASRMESNSLSGKIHCSEAAAKILAEQAPDMPLKRRGKVQVKGKGTMTTYWVGHGMLREDVDGSISRTYDEHPIVSFQEPGTPTPNVKPSALRRPSPPPVMIGMDGELHQTTSNKTHGKTAPVPPQPLLDEPVVVRHATVSNSHTCRDTEEPLRPPSTSKHSSSKKIAIPEIPKFSPPEERKTKYSRSLSQ